MTNDPVNYNPKIYIIEETSNGFGYHQPVSAFRWWLTALITYPLRFLPLFKPYKIIYCRERVLRLRSDAELRFLNGDDYPDD
jgi:hypothetical protein